LELKNKIMGLFGNKNEGGLMDIIRCDEQEYMVWKWRPSGTSLSESKKANAIKWGSSLRVKEGEVAVFVYAQKDGTLIDFIEGPYDGTIKTSNFPFLTSIVGSAFGGGSPFQAEVYFINLSSNNQLKFGIPYFDIFDPRFIDLGVPCAVRGTITFNLIDYKNFIRLNRLINFDLDDFKNQIKDSFVRKAKSVIVNIPQENNIPVMQIERKIDEISDILQSKMKEIFDEFGVNLKRIDINAIEIEKENDHYLQLKKMTSDQQTKFIDASTDIDIEGKRMEMQGKNFQVHQLNQQTEVLKTAAENLGGMGNVNLGGSTLNPIGMMTGMNIGNQIGNQIGGMMNNQVPPPPPSQVFHISLNGQNQGTFNMQQLQEMLKNGLFSKQHHIWKEGMTDWVLAEQSTELNHLFNNQNTPPPPPTN
jgi:membrane protease subunit (stomatin/prohibitin family)